MAEQFALRLGFKAKIINWSKTLKSEILDVRQLQNLFILKNAWASDHLCHNQVKGKMNYGSRGRVEMLTESLEQKK